MFQMYDLLLLLLHPSGWVEKCGKWPRKGEEGLVGLIVDTGAAGTGAQHGTHREGW